MSVKAVLFDLDGTLLDTAIDLASALNRLREEHSLPHMELAQFKEVVTHGTKHIIKAAFNLSEDHPDYALIKQKFISYYEADLANATQFFPEMENVLNYLDAEQIPWGIVTNKLTRHTTAILKGLRIDHRPACVVCGDTLSTFKPDPAPILHACQLLQVTPADCLYVGDSAVDVAASKAAGTQSMVAMYGYLTNENPHDWQADAYINQPNEIIDWIIKQH